MADLHVETLGTGARVVLVHGSGNGAAAWDGQRALAERFTLVIPTRSGYPPNPPLERIDFETQADELAPLLDAGAHLVGHSYGGVIAMLAAARRPERVHSLAVSEPPAFGIAAGNADVDRFVARLEELFAQRGLGPGEHFRRFIAIVGVDYDVPDPLPAEIEAATRASMVERPPWEAELPLEALRAAPFPKLLVSGRHQPAFEAVLDVLERRLGAERAVVTGRGHNIPGASGYNALLESFWSRAQAARADARPPDPAALRTAGGAA